MEQEALLIRPLQAVDELLVFARSERRHDQRLRLATGEQGRAVRPGQDTDLRQDRAHGLQITAVDARAVVEDVPADHLGCRSWKASSTASFLRASSPSMAPKCATAFARAASTAL